jgi:hypothetical protein
MIHASEALPALIQGDALTDVSSTSHAASANTDGQMQKSEEETRKLA